MAGAAATVGGLVTGLVRARLLFLPGLAGITGGAILGWLAGRPFRGRATIGFGERLGFAAGAGTLYGTVSAVTASVFCARPLEAPIAWLRAVISGLRAEPFLGFSRYSLEVQGGGLEGGWWLAFVVLDAALFAFLFLVSLGAGELPDAGTEEPEDDGLTELAEDEEEDRGGGRRGGTVFAAFCGLAILGVALPAWWGGPAGRAPDGIRLAGRWVVPRVPPALAGGHDTLRFRLVSGPGGEVVGISRDGTAFRLSATARRDGVWEGTAVFRLQRILPIRFRPLDPDRLQLVVDLDTITGVQTVSLEAHRTADR